MLLLFHSDVIIHYSHPAELNQISTLIGTTNSDIYHITWEMYTRLFHEQQILSRQNDIIQSYLSFTLTTYPLKYFLRAIM